AQVARQGHHGGLGRHHSLPYGRARPRRRRRDLGGSPYSLGARRGHRARLHLKDVLPDLARASEAIARRGGDLGKPLYLLSETSSTNDEAKRASRTGALHGSTWIA